MAVNPFNKKQFNAHRDWEQSLVEFFVHEVKQPDVRHWLSMVNGAESCNTVAFSALFLYNLVSNKPRYADSANTLYSVYEMLKGEKTDASEFEAWLKTDWFNVSRVANMFKVELLQHRPLP